MWGVFRKSNNSNENKKPNKTGYEIKSEEYLGEVKHLLPINFEITYSYSDILQKNIIIIDEKLKNVLIHVKENISNGKRKVVLNDEESILFNFKEIASLSLMVFNDNGRGYKEHIRIEDFDLESLGEDYVNKEFEQFQKATENEKKELQLEISFESINLPDAVIKFSHHNECFKCVMILLNFMFSGFKYKNEN